MKLQATMLCLGLAIAVMGTPVVAATFEKVDAEVQKALKDKKISGKAPALVPDPAAPPPPSASSTLPIYQTVPVNIANDGQTITVGRGQMIALTHTTDSRYTSIFPSYDEKAFHHISRHSEPYTKTVYHLLAMKTGEYEVAVLGDNPGDLTRYASGADTIFKVKIKVQDEPVGPGASEPSVITAANNGQEIEVPAGQTFIIKLRPEVGATSLTPAFDSGKVRFEGSYREYASVLYKFVLTGESAKIVMKAYTYEPDFASERDVFSVTVKRKK